MTRLRSAVVFLVMILAVGAVAGVLLLSPSAARRAHAQTVPTITPTPGDDPTSPAGPTSPAEPTASATSPTQQSTATRRPAGQATATRSATRTPVASVSPTAFLSAAEAAWPTAEPCSLEPTILVLDGGAWLYEGPGEDYDRLGWLEEDTVRPLLARAAVARWWLVELTQDEHGWIADEDVEVQGDTSELPVADAPDLPDGETPTPGPTWEPTLIPDCTTPTPTPTATDAATSTPLPTATLADSTEEAPATETPEAAATDESTPLPEEEEGNSLMWLPVAVLVLLAAGAFLYVSRRS